MSPDKPKDDETARKSRAEQIRRMRDERNRSVNAPEPNKPPDEGAPNYVDAIDRKMRRDKKDSS